MILFHGSWLPSGPTDKSKGFFLWAETNHAEASPARIGDVVVPLHPFAVPGRALARSARELFPFAGDILKRDSQEGSAVAWLPSAGEAPLGSPELLLDSELPEGVTLRPWWVDALFVPAHAVPGLLIALPTPEETIPDIRVGSDLRYWGMAARFVLELIAHQRFRPGMARQGEQYLAIWEPILDDPADQQRFTRLVQAMPPVGRALLPLQSDRALYERPPAEPGPRGLLTDFISAVVDEFARRNAIFEVKKSTYSFPSISPPISVAWMDALAATNPQVRGSPADLKAFYEQYRAWSEPIPGATGADTFRLCFRLDPPNEPASPLGITAPRTGVRNWTLHYLLQATDDPSLMISAGKVWRERGSELRFLNRRFQAPQERLLAGLGQASRVFAPIEASLRSPRPETAALTLEEAYTFMRETALLLRSFGFGVLVPGVTNKLAVRVRMRPKQSQAPQGGVAGLTFDSIVQYDWQLALGGQPLSREELDRLADLKVPLVQVRGQWVEVKPEQIEKALDFWEKRKGAGEMTLQEAMRLALALEAGEAEGLPVAEVVAEGWMKELMEQLGGGQRVRPVPVPGSFNGSLRKYQEAGLSWLAFLRQWGLGACLADDMGLGKTVQMAALLLHEKEREDGDRRPALVICPTSVVSNWQRELERFAPELRVLVHHGAGRQKTDLPVQAAKHDVVISSYALLPRDEKHLAEVEWGDVVLDEAQNIKNSATKQAQAARRLPARWRVALTGTPVENRLAELWSIFQFLNPGYLGSQVEFRRRLANPIERAGDPAATRSLRSLVSPFILRRVKTDPTVISDLPQKNEMKVYCNLTKEQATLYAAIVKDSLKRIQESEGIERRGVVLATITKLKQVCNHPAQFLADDSALPGRSGKLARLTEMLQEVRGVDERALVFTQFAEMGKLLQAYLREAFGEEVLFLYGATPAKHRQQMIDRFQSDPHGPFVFILSIKAGGTGLNLTRANHVFHFDRWWNPAVENQATDRAFRIGQTRNVQVYKYLCAGTFEDKIDEMIERKKGLAESIVGTSEAWITELSTDELRDLFTLRKDAIGDT